MFARALSLFPYVVLSLDRMGRQGLGRPVAENRGRRGEFRVREVVAEKRRIRVTTSCRVGEKMVLDGEAVLKVPSRNGA